jgi:mannosyltransferase
MLCGISGPSYWSDETATISAATRSLPQLVRMLGRVDAVHGLYYLLMWLVARTAGTSELAFRLPSAVGLALAASGIAAIGWRLRGWRTGLLAGLLLPCIPELTLWGQNARPFALEIAAAVFASYRLLDVIDSRGRWRFVWYAGSIALLGYINLFGLLLVPAHAITVAAGRQSRTFRDWLIAAAAGCLTVTPVAIYGWRERGQIAWIARPGLSAVQDLVTTFGGGTVLTTMIIAALAVLGAVCAEWPARRRPDDSLIWLCLPWLVVPPVILVTLSQGHHLHLYGISYVLYCIPPLVLLAGAGLASLWTPWRLSAFGLFVLLVLPGQLAVRKPDADGDNLRAAAVFLEQHARNGQAVIYWGNGSWEVPDWASGYPYGFTKLRDIGEQSSPTAVGNLFGTAVSPAVLQARMRQVSQLWVIELGRDQTPSAVSTRSFRLAGSWDFSNTWLRLYER